MKHLLAFVVLVFSLTGVNAQMPGQLMQDGNDNPAEWTGALKEKDDGSYDLIFKADIEEGWHIFSQYTDEGGGLPLEINFHDEGGGFATNGDAQESETIEQFSEIFEVDEEIFENKAVLTQNINLTDDDTRYVKAEVNYQVCQDACINDEQYFVFDVKEKKVQIIDNYDDFEAYGQEVSSQNDTGEENTQTNANPDESNGAGTGMLQEQGKSPAKWTGKVKKKADDHYALIFKADIEKGWHIFSQYTDEGGGLPLEISFHDEGEDFATNGDAQESETIEQFSEIFEVDEEIFEDQAVLTQEITLDNQDTRYIRAEVNYQVCQDACINEEQYFVFDLEKEEVKIFANYDDFVAYGEDSSENATASKEKGQADSAVDEDSSSSGSQKGLWTTFILAFLWGFAALLTPCVFPMIPMTVSFFTKQSKSKALGKRNAILYSLFIIVIYVILGTLVVGIFGADSLNKLSTNVTFNIIFAIILIIFAISFLGAFEIVLPSSWANKVDKQADRGGVIGIFFMALALAIVSFSCTGPIIGTLLVQASSQGGIAPIIGMLGFSLALAIPFGLFALFPGWMNSLPKSGGWLNSVKVVLGLLELAFAFKFLSNADLVVQGYYLPREMFLAIWIAIFGVMAFYLFGKIQLPNDSKTQNISVGRFAMGLLVLSFTIYMIPGIWGAPLKLLSGYLPPEYYTESTFARASPGNLGEAPGTNQEIAAGAVYGPQHIPAFREYEKGLAYARKVGKPILLDFTGMACVNCRKMEDRVWSKNQVKTILNEEVVMISLYVDIDKKLPEDEQYTSETTGRRIRTVGNKWSDFQIEHYQMNAQPYYVLVDPETEENLNDPVAYMPDADEYAAWLKDGIGNYDNNTGDHQKTQASLSKE